MTDTVAILVVDDEELVRDAIVMVLERQGYHVHTCASASEALALDNLTGFKLILTDLVMPKMDGVQFIKEIRNQGIATPILAITGGARIGQKNMAERAIDAGAKTALQKPVSRKDLLAAINEVLEI